jgi:hypothetical protein
MEVMHTEMPAQHHIDNHEKIIVTKWIGEATDDSLLQALKNYQAEIQNDTRCLGYDDVVDFRDVPTFKISIKGLKNIGKTASSTDQHRLDTCVAFIVSTNLAVNLVKLYAAYRNFGKMPKKYIRAFKNEAEAYEWVRNNRQANHLSSHGADV